jgi:hypothetical protein
MKFENFFYQNDQQKKLYKDWYKRKFSESFVIFWLTTRRATLQYLQSKNIAKIEYDKFMYFNLVDAFHH